tara:strand:+ start:163 stop:534 length:372 start_codon:yes stop_codon:yes gene_type:complete
MVQIKRETKKALLLETEDGKTFWIQKRWMRDDGTLTPKGLEALNAAGSDSPKKAKPFVKCKFKDLREISEKAIVVECFDGSSDILPKSQIRISVIEDSLLMPVWLAEQKSLQYAEKKIWIEDE